MVLARGWYTTGKVFFSIQGHKPDCIPCAGLHATPSLVGTFLDHVYQSDIVSIHLSKLTSEFTYLSATIVFLMHDTRYIV